MGTKLIITDAGFAEVVNAEKNGTAPVLLKSVGVGTGKYEASASQTALQSEIKRLDAISGGGIGDNIIHITLHDNSADAYVVYEVGIFTEAGTLFCVYSQNTPIVQKSAGSELLFAFDIVLANINAESLTIGDTNFLISSATTERQGIVELATGDETAAGTDGTRAVTPASLISRTATTARRGLVELATIAETAAGTDAERAVTPQGLYSAFGKQHLETGFQKIAGGLVIQWGRALVANGDNGTNVVFPTAFPAKCASVVAVSIDNVAVSFRSISAGTGGVTLRHNGNGGVNAYWIAVGY